MKISIIVPIYNRTLHIRRCLTSVLYQYWTTDIECILVDDASTDDSVDIVKDILAHYCGDIRCHLYLHGTHLGVSAARNTGLKYATGEYVFFLDSDDEIMPDALSSFVILAQKYPTADVICGDYYTAKDSNNLQNQKGQKEFDNSRDHVVDALLTNKVSVAVHNKLIKVSVIVDNNMQFAEGIVHEDELWTYQISKFVKAMAVSYRPVYVYYQNPKGIVGSISMRNVECYIDILKRIWDDGWWEFPKPKIYTINKILQKCIADFNHVTKGQNADVTNLGKQNTLNLMQRRLLKNAISNGCYSIASKCFVKICIPNALFRRLKSLRQRFL